MLDSTCQIRKQWFIQSREGNIDKYYKFDFNPKTALGAGTYGSVFKGINIETNETRAIKAILKSKVKNQERFKIEIDIMRKLDHPNVIKLYETFEDPKYLYLVMELCEGGELFDRIIAKGHFNEAEARSIFKQIMHALFYCHSNKICHRDLKPENFLLLNKKDDNIKVIDFGLSTFITSAITTADSKIHMKTKAGTPYYISPEVLSGDYDEGCDIWSSGVILYILISGVPPFYGNTDPEILEMVKKGAYSLEIPEFKGVSDEAKDLIRKMICKPDKRLKAGEVLEHPWMKRELDAAEKQEFNWGSFKKFQSHRKIKRVALTYIASQLQESEIIGLGKLFKQLDKNGDGVLTIEEIKFALGETNDQNLIEIQKVLHAIDTDGSGTINYTEFLAATMEKSIYMKKEKIYQAFKTFDLDGSGKISALELKNILGKEENLKNKDDEYWKTMINEADKNGDGEIDYNEFFEMMESALN